MIIQIFLFVFAFILKLQSECIQSGKVHLGYKDHLQHAIINKNLPVGIVILIIFMDPVMMDLMDKMNVNEYLGHIVHLWHFDLSLVT